jgi:hypothetical protein
MKIRYYSYLAYVVPITVTAGLILAAWSVTCTGQGQDAPTTSMAFDGNNATAEDAMIGEPNTVAATDPTEQADGTLMLNTPEKQSGWAKYDIILRRNIFSRNRQVFRPRQFREERRVVVPNPESYFRLRGITQEDGTFVAFLEDTRTNVVLRLRAGDSVARGAIKSLSLDSLEYQLDERTVTVFMGQDLEGGQGAITASELAQWSETAASLSEAPPAGETPLQPTGDEADLLRQLMERRRQQLDN